MITSSSVFDHGFSLLEDGIPILLTIYCAHFFRPVACRAHFKLRSLAHLRIVKDRKDSCPAAAHQSVPRAKAQEPSFDFRNFRVSGETVSSRSFLAASGSSLMALAANKVKGMIRAASFLVNRESLP